MTALIKHFSAKSIHRLLDYPRLIDHLEQELAAGGTAPPRHHHTIRTPDGENTLVLMPAWQEDVVGLKVVSVVPSNSDRNLPTIVGLYLLLDSRTGTPLALMDGGALTVRRTAAASALAARHLARHDSRSLLMVGAGTLAPHLVRAHAATLPLDCIRLWNRTAAKAEKLCDSLKDLKLDVEVVDDLESAATQADLISCATSSDRPLILGRWLSPGTHLDLVGGFSPQMHEVDEEGVVRARIFVDSRQGVLSEAGDLITPINRGKLTAEEIEADLFQLTQGFELQRKQQDITLFKSVGMALEDLAAARLVIRSASHGNGIVKDCGDN